MKSFIASLIAAFCVATASAQSNTPSTAFANGTATTVKANSTAQTETLPAVTKTTASTTSLPQTVVNSASVQTPNAADLIKSTETAKNASEELLKLQQERVNKMSESIAQLQQLYNDGLIARVELEKSQQELADAKAKVTQTEAEIANSIKLAAEMKKASALAKLVPANKLVKPVLKAINTTGATVMRSTIGSWSMANLSQVQQFFSQTFGHSLPVSTIGQSATHNRMGWDHRNAVDIGIHPDSQEGRALMSYLQMSGIPFLAFRAAVPGVSTGPHIHIGFPSHKLG